MTSLPTRPTVSDAWRGRLERVAKRTSRRPPRDLAAIVQTELGVDLTARYAGLTVPHPFGKGSGQLSLKPQHIEADAAAGLAFVVLKTVIAESSTGERSMEAWTIPESRMRVERRPSASGREGWTVTWSGRGWSGSLDDYLEFFAEAIEVARHADLPVIPSVKYHLSMAAGEEFRADEYVHTTGRLLQVWDRVGCGGPMVLEKDLSPTLAGDARSRDREQVLRWLEAVPGLVADAAPGRTRLGVKVMNALFDDAFQVDMLLTLARRADPPPAFLVVFNRLFDPAAGVAYGGWDLSDRNLRALDALGAVSQSGAGAPRVPPLCGTGNICSGRMMLEYALRGCESGQLHTFFQLPLTEYTASAGSRPARALHTLLLHPTEGLAVWLRHLHEAGRLEPRDGCLRFLDAVGAGPS